MCSSDLEGQEEFYKAAEEAAEQHKKLYPNYVYSPKEARIQKEMKKFNNMQNVLKTDLYLTVKIYDLTGVRMCKTRLLFAEVSS